MGCIGIEPVGYGVSDAPFPTGSGNKWSESAAAFASPSRNFMLCLAFRFGPLSMLFVFRKWISRIL